MRRQFRLATVVAVLTALGLFAIAHGAWVVGLAALAVAAVIVAAFLSFVFFPARISRDSVLKIRLTGRIREHSPHSPIDQLTGRGFPSLHQLRRALEAARSDASIRTAIVEIAGLEIGLATACEIHDLLGSLRSVGKRVVAILAGDNATVREYLAASGAGEVVANPDIGMMMLGVVAGSYFLKGALAKVHVQAQTVQYKEYKGAAEMFTRDAMSPELRESLDAIIADWQVTLGDKVAAARKLDPASARRMLGEGFISAETARAAGLIDRVGYVEDLEAELDPEGRDRRSVSLARYLRRVAYLRRPAKARIALVHALGPVVSGDPPLAGEYLSGEAVAAEINRAARDRSVRAIVLRVNSPGGSAVGSDLVWRATLEAHRRGKPLVVSMGDVAGSGGYYVAMAADAIVAGPATITGSIGVVYSKLNLGGLLAELGVRVDYAKSGEISDALSAARALSETELAQLNKMVGELYATFTKKVADGRKLSAERTEEVARGRVWSGIAARERGLVDELGGLERAIQIARDKAGLRSNQPHELVTFPESTLLSGLRLALMPAQMPVGMRLAAKALEIPADWAPATFGLLAETRALLLCPLF